MFSGAVTTIAGVPRKGGFKEGDAKQALFNQPCGMCFDPPGLYFIRSQPSSFPCVGNLLVADKMNHRIRLINLKTNQVSTLIGTGEAKDEEGPVATASIRYPQFVVSDAAGNVYIYGGMMYDAKTGLFLHPSTLFNFSYCRHGQEDGHTKGIWTTVLLSF